MYRREFLRFTGRALGASACSLLAPNSEAVRAERAVEHGVKELVNLAAFEEAATRRLSHMAYEYIAGGAGDEITVRWNREALDAIRLNARVLSDAQPVDMAVTLFGQKQNSPILLAPTAFHRLAHREGELETARGANAAGVTFVVSSLTTRRLTDISGATQQPLWFQLFVLQKDRREFVREVLAEAKANRCRAIVLTVDAPVTGARNRSERAHFHLPDAWETPYYPDRAGRKQSGGLPISGSLTWSDVEWLRANTSLPVVLKGILNPADAKQAVAAGVDGLVVSNHGGRELDTVPASITMLPKVVEAVENRIPVLMDSGIRRGTDVLKALAFGAKAVLIGRPYLYGLACGGAQGVTRVVEILRREFEMAMVLTGRRYLTEIGRDVIG